MIKSIREIFEANDGKIFFSEEEARKHEAENYRENCKCFIGLKEICEKNFNPEFADAVASYIYLEIDEFYSIIKDYVDPDEEIEEDN